MIVFNYDNYKGFVQDWVKSQPKEGYGQLSRMAEKLRTNPVSISQIFRGDRELNLEQAAKLCDFLGFNTLESDYFLLLVQKDRAGSHDLQQIFARQLKELRGRGQLFKNRIRHSEISENDKLFYYSSWLPTAVWLAASLPQLGSSAKIAAYFKWPEAEVAECLRFLLDRGLLRKKAAGFDFGENMMLLSKESPHNRRNLLNWRIKAMQVMEQKNEENLYFTASLAMSRSLKKKIREEIKAFLLEQMKQVPASPSECLVALNVDWFEF